MISAGIKDVKNNLSRLLARVKAGEEIRITERGRPIARIVKENREDDAIRAALEPLVRNRQVILPARSILKDNLVATEVTGKPVSTMVMENRR